MRELERKHELNPILWGTTGNFDAVEENRESSSDIRWLLAEISI